MNTTATDPIKSTPCSGFEITFTKNNSNEKVIFKVSTIGLAALIIVGATATGFGLSAGVLTIAALVTGTASFIVSTTALAVASLALFVLLGVIAYQVVRREEPLDLDQLDHVDANEYAKNNNLE